MLEAGHVGEVYNIGGGRANSCSILEAIRHASLASDDETVERLIEQNKARSTALMDALHSLKGQLGAA